MNTQDSISAQSHKDPAQLEREIDQKRGHIEQIVSALESKLTPGEIFDRVLTMTKGGGGQFASNLGDTIKANPVPALLTAAGLAWLYSGRNKPVESHRSPRPAYGASSSTGTSTSSMYATGSLDSGSSGGGKLDAAKDKLDSAKDKVSSAGHRVTDATRNAAHTVSEKTRNAAGMVSDKAHDAADAVRSGAHRASEGMHRMLEENPMAVGALAIAAGALLGAVIPKTRKEDELMGPTSDRLTDKAKEKAKEAARTGRETLVEASREVTAASDSGSKDKDREGDSLSMGTVTSTKTVSATTTTPSPQRPH